ncbi:MAG: 3-dehydroquinate synthase [Candidatus Methylomirabilales bacterium]
MEQVTVHLRDRSYPIYIGAEILPGIGGRAQPLSLSGHGALITNPVVGGLYSSQVLSSFERAGIALTLLEVPDGEAFKSLEVAQGLYDRLFPLGLDRRSPIVALGGGVIGDLAGFVAATYMRGLPLIQVPTSLLAQVDSSVGGKVGVNLPQAKNMIGAFYQPLFVLSDVSLLRTLPPQEFQAGMAEVVKYGVIEDKEFFEWLEGNVSAILERRDEVVIHIVGTACRIKAVVVEKDERDEGLRAILNFGHTVGHALEAASGYGQVSHGQAVAIGMVTAARISYQMGLCSEEVPSRLARLLERIGLPTALPHDPKELIHTISYDKKLMHRLNYFILTKDFGSVTVTPILDPLEALQKSARDQDFL